MVTIYIMINDFFNGNNINDDFNTVVNEIQNEFNYVHFYIIVPDEFEYLLSSLSEEEIIRLPELIHIKNKFDIKKILPTITKDNILISSEVELVQAWELLNGKSIFYAKKNGFLSKPTSLVIFKNYTYKNVKDSIIKYSHLC